MKDVNSMIAMTGVLAASLFVLKHLNDDNLDRFKDGSGKLVWWLITLHLILALTFSITGLLIALHAFDTWGLLSSYGEYKVVGSLVFALLARELIPMLLDMTLDFSQHYANKAMVDLKNKTNGTPHKDGLACDYERERDPVNKKKDG